MTAPEPATTRMTTAGSVIIVLLVAAVAFSPIFLVFSPAVPLFAIVYVAIRRDALGSSWLYLWGGAWVAFVVNCWPFLGLDV